MGIHPFKPGQITAGNVSQPEVSRKTQKRNADEAPTIKTRSKSTAQSSPPPASVLDSHGEPRVTVRSDTAAVHQALGSQLVMLDGIDPQRLSGFYKHANMIVNGKANNKNFLLECLVNLYLSAPDSSHPNAVDPEWVDDQDVLWGDELLYLFEAAPQIDKLDTEGKRSFADSLAARVNIDRQFSGSVDALEQALHRASRRMALTDAE